MNSGLTGSLKRIPDHASPQIQCFGLPSQVSRASCGAGEAEAYQASRPNTAPPSPRAHTTGAAERTRPPTCQTPGGAQRDPPPTRRGEARAAVGNERHAAPPRGRRTRLPPLPRRAGESCSAHVLRQSPRWPLLRSGGAAAGGSGTPRLPLGSLEKAFSPRARRPSPGPSRLRAHGGAPRAARPQPGGRGLRYREADHHTGACARSGPEQSPRPAPCKASSAEASATRGTGTPLPSASTPPKDSHARDTHATVAGTRGGRRVEGNDTTARPQAPEGRPGALQGHHRGSHEARSHTRVGRAARQRRHSPPRHREGRSPGTRRGGEAGAICRVRRPTAPTDAPRQGTGDRRSGPEATPNPCLPHPP